MNWLLMFVPLAIGLELLAPQQHLYVFLAAAVAVLPLAGWMSRATEHLAERSGEGVGGLLNATFGNSAELIIALAALRAGLYDVVKASIPSDFTQTPTEGFDPVYMTALYERGYEMGLNGYPWKKAPPGFLLDAEDAPEPAKKVGGD